MDAAVQFDGQGRLKAEEVDDEGADGRLPPPLPAFQPAGAEDVPEPGLSVRLVASQAPGAIPAELRGDGDGGAHGPWSNAGFAGMSGVGAGGSGGQARPRARVTAAWSK